MTALGWSSLVECMHVTGVDLDRIARTFILLRVCFNLTVLLVWRCYWCSMNAVWDRNFTLICCPNILQLWWWWLCVDFRSLNVSWDRCRIGPGRTVRTFILHHVLLQYDVVIILSSSCAVQIHYNGDAWRLCVDLCWLNVCHGCRVDSEQIACKLL